MHVLAVAAASFVLSATANVQKLGDFNITHDMPFHLFVVSQDFEDFQHIHPVQQPDGSFTIETMLPRAGYYKIFCDFFPAGGTPQVPSNSTSETTSHSSGAIR